jgi:hypothetical protein
MNSMFRHLDRIIIGAEDPEEAAEAWQVLLGLPKADGEAAPALQAGRVILELQNVHDGGREGLLAFIVEVEDLTATVEHLRSSGVVVSTPQIEEDGRDLTAAIDPVSTHGVAIRLVERSGGSPGAIEGRSSSPK